MQDMLPDDPLDKKSEQDRTLEIMIRLQMKSRAGRRFVWEVMCASGMMNNPLSPDPITIGFNVGKQDMGRWLFGLVDTYCPELYPVMVKESKEELNEND